MSELDIVSEIETLSKRSKTLLARRETLQQNKQTILAELEARRRSLKKLMDDVEKEGFDPNNLKADLLHKIEVERTKLEVLESDLATSEAVVRPMLEEIRKG
jgi:methionine salvage enolase-phosphatase E1